MPAPLGGRLIVLYTKKAIDTLKEHDLDAP